ncbi:hypothetical protein SLOPH_598, partial [Spraguea lophii 42_110]
YIRRTIDYIFDYMSIISIQSVIMDYMSIISVIPVDYSRSQSTEYFHNQSIQSVIMDYSYNIIHIFILLCSMLGIFIFYVINLINHRYGKYFLIIGLLLYSVYKIIHIVEK